jgi:imidazole glycerol-phosphate synthase subunit HisH
MLDSPIQIIDAGFGNIKSIYRVLKALDARINLIRNGEQLDPTSKIILAGVGAFNFGITCLRDTNFIEPLRAAVMEGTNILGICLGMQMLFDRSEEGNLPGLGLIGGHVKRFDSKGKTLKVPHMGWNIVKPVKSSSLFTEEEEELRYYFVHSYYVVCNDANDVTATTDHGHTFACAVERGNIMGVQFHPEKSHRFGKSLLKKFIEL